MRALILVVLFSIFCIFHAQNKSFAEGLLPQACFKENCINLEIARTDEELMRGLQGREFLAADNGMLFIFPDSQIHYFWMKNTNIPLDMIWLDSEGVIIGIEKSVPPCLKDPCPSYGPPLASRYVLETQEGLCGQWGLHPNDKIDFNLEN